MGSDDGYLAHYLPTSIQSVRTAAFDDPQFAPYAAQYEAFASAVRRVLRKTQGQGVGAIDHFDQISKYLDGSSKLPVPPACPAAAG